MGNREKSGAAERFDVSEDQSQEEQGGGPRKKGDSKRNTAEIENKFCAESPKILASWQMQWTFSLLGQWRNQDHVKYLFPPSVVETGGGNSCLCLGGCLLNISLMGSA